jgi:hypothetical protein
MVEQLLAAGANKEAQDEVRGGGGVLRIGKARGAILSCSCYLLNWLWFGSAVGYQVISDVFVKVIFWDTLQLEHGILLQNEKRNSSFREVMASRVFFV